MTVAEIALYIYLGIGLIYGLYILVNGLDRWYVFPINVLGGPIALIYIVYLAFANKMPK